MNYLTDIDIVVKTDISVIPRGLFKARQDMDTIPITHGVILTTPSSHTALPSLGQFKAINSSLIADK